MQQTYDNNKNTKRKILFVVVAVILLFLCVFTIALCSNKPKDNYYTITFKDHDGTELQTSSVKEGETPTYNKANPTRDNDDNYSYAFSGWSPSISKVNADTIYTATYTSTIRQYNLTLSKNIDNAGDVDGEGTYHFNDSLTITAETNPGYTFVGWYDGETQVSNELSYTFNMPAVNKLYEARWAANIAYKVEHYWQNIDNDNYAIHETDNLTGIKDTLTNAVIKTYTGFTSPTSVEQININGDGSTVVKLYYTRNEYTVSLSKNIDNAGNVTGAGTYKYGEQVNIDFTTNTTDGYRFMGWYDGKTQVSNKSYTFDMPAKNITYTAINYKKYENENNEKKVYFGTYPQKKVEDQNENEFLSNKYKFDSTTWTSYKYYVEGTQSDYMYYKDVDTNKDGINDYRGVYFTQYRPSSSSDAFPTDNSTQDEKAYKKDTIYWFKYDPIEWNILKEEDGKALILANLILDTREYYPSNETSQFKHNDKTGYANNYELSEIRKFLKENFYKTAFIDLEKDLIQNTTVDNSTQDKMFLLSSSEALNSDYGFTSKSARIAQGSDYAKCQRLFANNENSPWWLRSPDDSYAASAYFVFYDGSIYGGRVYITSFGVRPACWINLP